MPIIEDKLKELGLTLPAAPVAGGSYLPHRINGNTLILAGVISVREGVMTHVGQVGAGVHAAGPVSARLPDEHFTKVPPWRKMGLKIEVALREAPPVRPKGKADTQRLER